MATYYIEGVSIGENRDRLPYEEYIERARPVIEQFGGKYLATSANITSLAGNWKPNRVIIIQFDSRDQLDTCFSSPAYKQLAALRSSSITTNTIIIEE